MYLILATISWFITVINDYAPFLVDEDLTLTISAFLFALFHIGEGIHKIPSKEKKDAENKTQN